jgi:hypothetical protein
MKKKRITIWIDGDTVEWFKSLGGSYQTKINSALRSHIGHVIKENLDPPDIFKKPKKPSKVISELRDEIAGLSIRERYQKLHPRELCPRCKNKNEDCIC